MTRLATVVALAVVTLLAIACGASPTATPPPTLAPTATATTVPATAARAAATSATGGATPAAGNGTPAAPPAFVSGTIQSITADMVTLADGQSFAITARTGYVRQVLVKPADLMPGMYLGIRAKRQADNTLLASVIDIFGQKGSGNQFPLLGGDLMTNATIDKIEGNTVTVSFTGGGAVVTLAPDTQIYQDQTGTAADAKVGSMVTIIVTNGAAGAIRVH
jgi:hypothetical protein